MRILLGLLLLALSVHSQNVTEKMDSVDYLMFILNNFDGWSAEAKLETIEDMMAQSRAFFLGMATYTKIFNEAAREGKYNEKLEILAKLVELLHRNLEERKLTSPKWQSAEDYEPYIIKPLQEVFKDLSSTLILIHSNVSVNTEQFESNNRKCLSSDGVSKAIYYLSKFSQTSNDLSNHPSLATIAKEFVFDNCRHTYPLNAVRNISIHFYSAMIAASMCGLKSSIIEEKLDGQLNWMGKWINQLLESTWSTIEKEQVEKILTGLAEEQYKPKDGSFSCKDIMISGRGVIYTLKIKMAGVGHPRYQRNFLYGPDERRDKDFLILAKNPDTYLKAIYTPVNSKGDATQSENKMAIILRSRKMNKTEQEEKKTKLNEWLEKINQNLLPAMENTFYNTNYLLSEVVKRLKTEYGVDLQDWTAGGHEFMIISKQSSTWSKDCKSQIVYDSTIFSNIHYHFNLKLTCQDWKFIFL